MRKQEGGLLSRYRGHGFAVCKQLLDLKIDFIHRFIRYLNVGKNIVGEQWIIDTDFADSDNLPDQSDTTSFHFEDFVLHLFEVLGFFVVFSQFLLQGFSSETIGFLFCLFSSSGRSEKSSPLSIAKRSSRFFLTSSNSFCALVSFLLRSW